MDTVQIVRRQFFLSLGMLGSLIQDSPEEVWSQKRGGYVYWQQLLHALTGTKYWLRSGRAEPFIEPFADRSVYPELEKDPESTLTRAELTTLLEDVRSCASRFFDGLSPQSLSAPAAAYEKITTLDVICMQIRHLHYHVGHCDAILRELGYPGTEWLDYLGN